MSWTDERIATLKRMWLDGHTASQIAGELGGVSRNAVIGKAHGLGLLPTSVVTQPMLGKIVDLPLGDRAQRSIANNNMIFVGDLVQNTEAELLVMPGFGRRSLEEVKKALEGVGLRLGVELIDWPPADMAKALKQWETARRVSELRQARGGATFQPIDDHFAMVTEGDENDLVAALRPMTQQMQSALLQKARRFADVAARLDNQPG
jgi:hypothetical protein